jgi:hypothetical protein
MYYIQYCGQRLWLTKLLRIREVPGFKSRPGDRVALLRFFMAFLRPSRQMPELVPYIRSQSFPSTLYNLSYWECVVKATTNK